jgi:hypothetical protein
VKRVNGVIRTAINALRCKQGSKRDRGCIIDKPKSFQKKISYDVVCDIVYDMKTRSYDVLFRICDVAYDIATYDIVCRTFDVVC